MMKRWRNVPPAMRSMSSRWWRRQSSPAKTRWCCEQRLNFSRYVEEGFSIGDCVIIVDGTLYIHKILFRNLRDSQFPKNLEIVGK